MNPSKKIFLAGGTGYLGGFILKSLEKKAIPTRLITRDTTKVPRITELTTEVIYGEVTRPDHLRGALEGIDTVISTIGITRQKDGLTYMDVDYGANRNLLQEAKRVGVNRFVYISAINGDKYKKLKVFEAKEKFVDELKASGLDYLIVRPNGFFSDMMDFLRMAKMGRIYLFGNGNQKFNPIHGEDLADAIVDLLDSKDNEITLGGPDILSLNQISELAFNSLKKPIRIIHLPDWLRKLSLWFFRSFTNVKTYGPIEFFLTLMAQDNIAPPIGKHHLKQYFNQKTSNI